MTDSNPLAYSPALESRETANLRANYQLFVDGEFTEGAGEPLRITEPATGELLTEVASANKSDVDKAVGAARRAIEAKQELTAQNLKAALNTIKDFDTGGIIGTPITITGNTIPVGRVYRYDAANKTMAGDGDWIRVSRTA